jgi:hypothetical protein
MDKNGDSEQNESWAVQALLAHLQEDKPLHLEMANDLCFKKLEKR